MNNKRTLLDRFLKKNLVGKSTERMTTLSLSDIIEALDDRNVIDLLYFDHPLHKVPSKIFRINIGHARLNNISVIDIKKLREFSIFKEVSIEDSDGIIHLDGTHLSKEEVLKISNDMYIGQLEVIKDNLDDVEEYYDGYILADGEDEIQDLLWYLTNDEEVFTETHYLADYLLSEKNFTFVDNLQIKLHLNKDIKFGK